MKHHRHIFLKQHQEYKPCVEGKQIQLIRVNEWTPLSSAVRFPEAQIRKGAENDLQRWEKEADSKFSIPQTALSLEYRI